MTNKVQSRILRDFLLFLYQCHSEIALESLDPSHSLRSSGARGLADSIIQFVFDKIFPQRGLFA